MVEEKKKSKRDEETKQEEAKPHKKNALVKSEVAVSEKAKEKEAEQEIPLDKAIKEMPPAVRQTLQSFFALVSRTTSSDPRHISLFEKFTDEHIDKYLDYIQRDDDQEYDLKRTNRWFYLGYALMALGMFVAGVVYLLPRDKDLLIQLIQIIVLIAGGIGAGIGIKSR